MAGHAGAVDVERRSDADPGTEARIERAAIDGADRLGDDAEFQTQLAEARARLLRDADPAGIDMATVQQAIDETVATYEAASVRSFLTVLIERDVRRLLKLHTSTEVTAEPA